MAELQPSPIARFFGAALMAVGALVIALCGACTLMFAGRSLIEIGRGHNGAQFAPIGILILALIVGGIPMLLGAAAFWGGRILWRGPRRPVAAKPPPSAPPPG
jgi:hypothetical protein